MLRSGLVLVLTFFSFGANAETFSTPLTDFIETVNYGGSLGLSSYVPASAGPYASASLNLTTRSGFTGQWLTGSAKDPGGMLRPVLMQLWNNGGNLAIVQYGRNPDGSYSVISNQPGQKGNGFGAMAFLAADVNGDGQTDIVQLWNNNGQLAMIVYPANANGVGYSYQGWSFPGTANIGASAVGFYAADVNGDGKSDVIQLWNNHGLLAMTVFFSNGTGYDYSKVWYTAGLSGFNVGGTILVGDVNGDGKADIIQTWNNGGNLAMIVFFSNGAGYDYTQVWSTQGLHGFPYPNQILTGDVNGDGKTDLIALFDNGGKLGVTLYESNGGGYDYTTATSHPAAANYTSNGIFFSGGTGNGRSDLVELWNNNGKLASVVYPSVGNGFDFTNIRATLGQAGFPYSSTVLTVDRNLGARSAQAWGNSRLRTILPARPPLPYTANCNPAWGIYDSHFAGVWMGGDGATPLQVNPFQVVFAYGDTFVSQEGSYARGPMVAGNTFSIASCGYAANKVTFSNSFSWKGFAPNAQAIFSPANPSLRYWVGIPFLLPPWDGNPSHSIAYFPVMTIQLTSGGAGFQTNNTRMIFVTNILDSYGNATAPISWITQDVPFINIANLSGGQGGFVWNGYAYQFNGYNNDNFLTRISLSALAYDPTRPSLHIEYLEKSGTWISGAPDLSRVKYLGIHANSGLTMRFNYKLGRFLALYSSTDVYPSANISVVTASAIEGPYSQETVVYQVPEMTPGKPGYDSQTFCYAAYEIPFNPDPDNQLVYAYKCNSFSLGKLEANLNLYFPKVVKQPIPAGL